MVMTVGTLRTILEEAVAANGYSRGDLTVLSAQVDPYRLDTPAGHRDGAWAAAQLHRAFGSERRTHWRGLHYAIVAAGSIRKPDGTTYHNTDEDWTWLSSVAGKAARWLGLISFERITDNRNSEPIVHRKARVMPEAFVSVGIDVDIPDIEDIEPHAGARGFVPRQAFSFAFFGEKASLEDVLLPLAERYEADLYLVTGEISDTLLHRIAKDAVADGRPLVMFTFSDCDPAGHQMPVSIGRKLQALHDLLFPDFQFEVVPVALTVEQVRQLNLPSTPLKETEKRADKWRAAFGVEQTEIDALATLRPDELRRIVTAAIAPYFDRTLAARVAAAKQDWLAEAGARLVRQIDGALLARLREQAATRLSELRDEIDRLNDQLQLAAGDDISLPVIDVPEPENDRATLRRASRLALVSFSDDWITATRALIKRKAYAQE
jgi:hypothetical protein